jgi:hypothetical protein
MIWTTYHAENAPPNVAYQALRLHRHNQASTNNSQTGREAYFLMNTSVMVAANIRDVSKDKLAEDLFQIIRDK